MNSFDEELDMNAGTTRPVADPEPGAANTATGAAMNIARMARNFGRNIRYNPPRSPVVVEQLHINESAADEIRITFDLAGRQHGIAINLDRYTLITMDPRNGVLDHYIADSIRRECHRSVADVIIRHVMDARTRTGRFDNTEEMRSAYEDQHRAMEEARFTVRNNMQAMQEIYNWQTVNPSLFVNLPVFEPGARIKFYHGERPQTPKNTPERRAWMLLAKTIGKARYRQFKKYGYFEAQGQRGMYRFHKDKQGGVTFIETRKYGERDVAVEFDLCVQSAAADLPAGDVIVSRYLSWKADEEKFLQTANFRKAGCRDEATAGRR